MHSGNIDITFPEIGADIPYHARPVVVIHEEHRPLWYDLHGKVVYPHNPGVSSPQKGARETVFLAVRLYPEDNHALVVASVRALHLLDLNPPLLRNYRGIHKIDRLLKDGCQESLQERNIHWRCIELGCLTPVFDGDFGHTPLKHLGGKTSKFLCKGQVWFQPQDLLCGYRGKIHRISDDPVHKTVHHLLRDGHGNILLCLFCGCSKVRGAYDTVKGQKGIVRW